MLRSDYWLDPPLDNYKEDTSEGAEVIFGEMYGYEELIDIVSLNRMVVLLSS